MPAAAAGGPKRPPWWQNPLLQAGGKAAFTAGAQAAMKSRGDPAPWLGAKGAKVGMAAIGAALVDGFMGPKHPGGQGMVKEGMEAALHGFDGGSGEGGRSKSRR